MVLAYSRQNDRTAGYAGSFLGSLGLGTAATVFDHLTTVAAGAGYVMGNVRMNALYTQSKIENAAIDATQKNVDLGVAWRYTPGNTLNVGYTNSRFEDARYNQFSLSNVYSFSKRTEVYAQAAYQRASGAARFAVQNYAGVSGNNSQVVTTVGVHHSF
jgi:predicted porin